MHQVNATKVLLADDDAISRRLLGSALARWGYEAVMVGDGAAAWEVLSSPDAPHLAILDWQMPGLSGVEICRLVRARSDRHYTYLLLLTARTQQADIITGLDAGADDYVPKPFHPEELRARLRAGRRLTNLETDLRAAMANLERARMERARAAGRIQDALLTGSPPTGIHGASIAALTVPSQSVDGDYYEFYEHSPSCVDIVVGDVMGKGIAAALTAAAMKSRLAMVHFALGRGAQCGLIPEPAAVVARLQAASAEELMRVETFSTLNYTRIDTQARVATWVDCGHMKTIYVDGDTGEVSLLEGCNMPIGFSMCDNYEQFSRPLKPGDLLVLYSDGITDAPAPNRSRFGLERLLEFVASRRTVPPADLVRAIRQAVVEFTRGAPLFDDLTCVIVAIDR